MYLKLISVVRLQHFSYLFLYVLPLLNAEFDIIHCLQQIINLLSLHRGGKAKIYCPCPSIIGIS